PRGFVPSAEPIGERVLVDLVARVPAAIVVGPRSTQPLRDAGGSLSAIARTLDTDYVLNANHSGSAEQPWMLVELIRVADGEHVWVERYDPRGDGAAIAEEIVAGAADVLVTD
ncbi:MAG TPA: hypothetical protein VG755_02335, partial [Nannocystaceae bacterium]|nr:hypothetical protein [Nannocystaceae bacterium]